ncbi:MAG: polysaccharide deacetylase family protein [Proteobacteria bacterium]|nr:polysaccharide deacetylase family protein [Pseudomonadota bacterium]
MTQADSSRLLFINYHYIRDPDAYAHPGIHPLAPAAFGKQVEWLRHHFHFATSGEVEGFVLEGRPLPRRSVFLTFDDGLADQWRAACEVLNPAGIRCAFFACSRPALEGRALTVQKIHWLRAHTEPEAFAEEFYTAIPRELRPTGGEDWAASAQQMYIYDSPEAGRLKYALNFVLPSELVDEATSQMLSNRGIDERAFCAETYMDADQLGQLTEQGHIVGVHGHRHEPFSKLGEKLIADVETNVAFLEEATGQRPRWASYPYGRDDAIPGDDELDALFSQCGLQLGITLTGTWNDGSQNPRRLHRINTNEVAKVAGSIFSTE